MLSTENNMVVDFDRITKVKLGIQRMYSPQVDSRCVALVKKAPGLRDVPMGDDLAEMFLYSEGKTLVQYEREVRVNKMKELLVYTDLSAESICQSLYYSSVNEMEEELAHLTGLSISYFQDLKKQKAALTAQTKGAL